MTHLKLSDLSPRERIIVARALLAVRRPSERTLRDALRSLENAPFAAIARPCSDLRRVDAFLERIVRVLDDGARLAAGTTPAPAFVDLGERRCECDAGRDSGATTCTRHDAGHCQNTATTHAATHAGDVVALCASCAQMHEVRRPAP